MSLSQRKAAACRARRADRRLRPQRLWARYNNTTWKKLHNASSQGLATDDLDGSGKEELLVDFGGLGPWFRYNDAHWMKRHNANTQDFAAAGVN